jgi:two-component system phosphate regulon sensor histidine kinase PhoR
MHNGEVMAVVTLLHSEPNFFDDHALRLVTIVANQTSVAIRNAQLFHRMQKQQSQLEAVLHAMPDLLLVLDETGKILLLNQTAAQMLDSASDPDVVLGTHLSDYLHLDNTFTLIDEIVSGPLQSGHSWSFEARSEQRRQDLLVTVSVWEAPTGGMAGYVVVMRDITMLRDLNRFKDEMLQMASHDLRSPLALIVGYCSLIEMDTPDPESPIHEYLSVIIRSTERMKGLLEDLLRVEQIRNSPLEMHQQVDFRELISAVLNNMRPLIDEKQQALQTKLQLDGLPGMMINPVLIREAMENLIGNAIKYTPQKGQIRVQAFEQGGRLHFVVEDDGVGIPHAHLSRVFESFFRARQRGADKVEGRGLGLSLVKTIVERHNGEVWVESEEGVGSRFGFWLPV